MHMQTAKKTELLTSYSDDARYAVDLITRIVRAIERHGDATLAEILGSQELADEVHHAIGWDIDWETIYQGMQGGG